MMRREHTDGTMQLSYSQNLEDYHLDGVFGDQKTGTYVDVGGGHPLADNVSFWFYLKGWRGLVVEAQQNLADMYAHLRPEDRVVSCLAGRTNGEAEFYAVEPLHGFSTTVRAHAEGAGRFGATYRTIVKPVRTLASLIDDAGLGAIDFLKIDVEGAEADVLAGMDFTRHRPRVICLEAARPGDMAENVQGWEADLIAHGYAFAFDDRLNRFYVADEAKELISRFPPEPAPWGNVLHLWDFSRAAERANHPDHTLAKLLQHGFLASLPALDPALVRQMLERGLRETGQALTPEHAERLAGLADPAPLAAEKPADLESLLASRRFRVALGRIAAGYDGGLILE
jgi:FkbM family methyltransferase